MKKFGLLGKDIAYSLSPKLHKKIMQYADIDGTYVLYDKEPDELPQVIELLRKDEIDGLNVTIPYKVDIMKYLDIISPEALEIGAVNCIVKNSKKLIGYNTDYYGIIESFKKLNLDLKDKTAFILGTGGAARSALKALKDCGADVTVVTRNRDHNTFPHKNITTYEEVERKNLTGYLLINCTPLGSKNALNLSAVSEKIAKGFNYIIDMVYAPEVTPLLSYTADKTHALNGMTMLIAQAIKAEELWSNKNINIDIEEIK